MKGTFVRSNKIIYYFNNYFSASARTKFKAKVIKYKIDKKRKILANLTLEETQLLLDQANFHERYRRSLIISTKLISFVSFFISLFYAAYQFILIKYSNLGIMPVGSYNFQNQFLNVQVAKLFTSSFICFFAYLICLY